MTDLIKLRGLFGQTEVNCRGVLYAVNKWGCVTVPTEDAPSLMKTGGFHIADEATEGVATSTSRRRIRGRMASSTRPRQRHVARLTDEHERDELLGSKRATKHLHHLNRPRGRSLARRRDPRPALRANAAKSFHESRGEGRSFPIDCASRMARGWSSARPGFPRPGKRWRLRSRPRP